MKNKIYISREALAELTEYLSQKNEIIPVGPINNVDPYICCHPDLVYCILPANPNAAAGSLHTPEPQSPAVIQAPLYDPGRNFPSEKSVPHEIPIPQSLPEKSVPHGIPILQSPSEKSVPHEIPAPQSLAVIQAPLCDPRRAYPSEKSVLPCTSEEEYPKAISPQESLGPEYPRDIPYNAAAFGRYFVHILKYTAPNLLSEAKKRGLTLVNVSQGYTKCNILIIDDTHIITEDAGIARVLAHYPELHCLKIKPGFVALPGYKYGFIGGCGGRVGSEIVFNGKISDHPEWQKIKEFICGCGISVKEFPWRLTDIGSILHTW